MSDQQTDLAFCQDQLRKLDPVRHFMALASPEEQRPALIAFYCFLNEIERIPKQVSEPAMGEIRLQWWLDVIDREYADLGQGCGQGNIGPVASCLKQVQRDYGLSKDQLSQIIEARKFDLYHDPMPDWDTFETYAGETKALPYLLAAQILNDGTPPDLADLCGNSAMAVCLTDQLSSFFANTKQQRLYLPLQEFRNTTISEAQLWAVDPRDEIALVLHRLADKAHDHLQLAQTDFEDLKQKGQTQLSSAFLDLALVSRRLKQCRKNPFGPRSIPLWRQYWTIWRYGQKS